MRVFDGDRDRDRDKADNTYVRKREKGDMEW